jgi:hypothetical protein
MVDDNRGQEEYTRQVLEAYRKTPGTVAQEQLDLLKLAAGEPATSSLGSPTYVGSKSLARFCCEFLNLQHLAESAFSKLRQPNEAQSRQARIEHLRVTVSGSSVPGSVRNSARRRAPCTASRLRRHSPSWRPD